jgi:hypothetical protein
VAIYFASFLARLQTKHQCQVRSRHINLAIVEKSLLLDHSGTCRLINDADAWSTLSIDNTYTNCLAFSITVSALRNPNPTLDILSRPCFWTRLISTCTCAQICSQMVQRTAERSIPWIYDSSSITSDYHLQSKSTS